MTGGSVQAQLYHRVRTNDQTLTCLRLAPSYSLPHVSDALLSNSSVTQVLLLRGGTTAPAPHDAGGRRAAAVAGDIPIDEFAQLLASLHHLPLKVLNVSELHLTDAHVNHIVDFIRTSKTIQRVHLSRNALSLASARRIGAVVGFHPSLQVLDLSSCALGDQGMECLLAAMPTPEACLLGILNVSHNNITMASFKTISEFVLENTSLVSFLTGGNFIQTADRVASIEPALARNMARKKKDGKTHHRPSSALGFLSTFDHQPNDQASAVVGDRQQSCTAGAALCPSLELLSRQLEDENRQQS